MICSKCKGIRDRGKERYCKKCHNSYNRELREKRGIYLGICPRCKIEKSILKCGNCRECKCQYDKEWRLKKDKIIPNRKPTCKCGKPRLAGQSALCRECSRIYYREYVKNRILTEEQKLKIRVRDKVRRMIKRKLLIVFPCEVCGEIKSQAHHDDYSKPLNIRWLCQAHHSEHHRRERRLNHDKEL